ncbi:MAG: hypothetical protein V1921_06670 [Candidatus Altiarchaeota archaeon]
MTGTKVVKLNLENGGFQEGLPSLKKNAVVEAVAIFMQAEYSGADTYYDKVLAETAGLDMKPQEIQETLEMLEKGYGHEEHFPVRAGSLLTALMQNSSQQEFSIKPKTPLDFLGYRLHDGKKITVEGDVGGYLGREMRNGTIHVNGNSGNHTAAGMGGGTIEVDGDAGEYTASIMHGGVLKVNGKIRKLADTFLNGEIWESGKRLPL